MWPPKPPVAASYVLETQTVRTKPLIRKLRSGEYRMYSRKKDSNTGKRRNLGTFPSLEKAKATEKSSIAELPFNPTWNIRASSGFLLRTSGQALQGAKSAPFRMTVRFRGRIDIGPQKVSYMIFASHRFFLLVLFEKLNGTLVGGKLHYLLAFLFVRAVADSALFPISGTISSDFFSYIHTRLPLRSIPNYGTTDPHPHPRERHQ